jgi:hypothetical protein
MANKKPTEDRITVANFPSDAGSRRPALYSHMLMEDLHSGILGYDLSEEGENRRILVNGEERGTAAVMALCASLACGSMHGGKIVESAIEAVALHLAWYGEAVYEICRVGEQNLSLESVPPSHLFRAPGAFIQLIPAQDRRWARGRRYTLLPARLAWVVRVPRELGGPRGYRKLLSRLTAMSASAPEFWNRDLSEGKFTPEFPFGDYNGMRMAYVARITHRWGWNRRDSSGTYDTEFFFFYRGIRFRRSQALLRDHIAAEINRLLTRLSISARIQLEGYRSPTEIGELLDRALSGSLHYGEAWRLSS